MSGIVRHSIYRTLDTDIDITGQLTTSQRKTANRKAQEGILLDYLQKRKIPHRIMTTQEWVKTY